MASPWPSRVCSTSLSEKFTLPKQMLIRNMAKVANAMMAKLPSLWEVAVFICVTIVGVKLVI